MISGKKTSSHDSGSMSAWRSKWAKPHVIEEGAEARNEGWSQEMQFFVSYGNQGQVLWSTLSFKLVLQPEKGERGSCIKGNKNCGKATGKCSLWETINCPQFIESLVNIKQNSKMIRQKTRSDMDHGGHSLRHPRGRSPAWLLCSFDCLLPQEGDNVVSDLESFLGDPSYSQKEKEWLPREMLLSPKWTSWFSGGC